MRLTLNTYSHVVELYIRPPAERERRVGLAVAGIAVAVLGALMGDALCRGNFPVGVTYVQKWEFVTLDGRLRALERIAMSKSSTAELKAAGLEAVYKQVTTTAERLDKLETVFAADLDRALSIPLLRQDLDNLRDEQTRAMAAMSAELTRATTHVTWGIGVISAAVLGFVLPNIFPKKQITPPSEKST